MHAWIAYFNYGISIITNIIHIQICTLYYSEGLEFDPKYHWIFINFISQILGVEIYTIHDYGHWPSWFKFPWFSHVTHNYIDCWKNWVEIFHRNKQIKQRYYVGSENNTTIKIIVKYISANVTIKIIIIIRQSQNFFL